MLLNHPLINSTPLINLSSIELSPDDKITENLDSHKREDFHEF